MIEQLAIGLLGAAGLVLLQSPDRDTRRWAPIVGLLAQPGWLHSTFVADQGGMFAVSLLYTVVWFNTLHAYWIAK